MIAIVKKRREQKSEGKKIKKCHSWEIYIYMQINIINPKIKETTQK